MCWYRAGTPMTAERWRQIEEAYHLALEYPPQKRGAFIAQACKGDEDLRKEIEDLVRWEESPGWGLPESPVWAAGDPYAAGTRLGPYEIVEAIGAGGMGLVFRAIDTRLGRSVAIKTSKGPFSDRFGREARTIASLNHPNICTLYDTGPDYLVMELIEGTTLTDRIRQGPIAQDEVLRIARQIACGLEAAHEKGIVHRDLKPANIKIRPDGSVKVLDFGLAKCAADAEPSADSVAIRRAGLILGTAAYMSPEQALGQEADKRSDIWAFGVVLYEMLAGARPFGGITVSDCLAEVVQKEPNLTKVPMKFRRLLSRCLEKDPTKRLRDLGDWEQLLDSEKPQPGSFAGPAWRKIAWVWIPAILVAAVAGWTLLPRPGPAGRTTRFQVTLPGNVAFDQYVSVSPDGQKLVFNATGEQSGLWIHDLATLEWRRMTGTEGGRSPFWSPDSRFLGFSTATQVKKAEVAGGLPVTLYTTQDFHPNTGAWSDSGVIVFGGGGVLHRVSASGGAVTEVTAIDQARGERSHGRPVFLPDGRHFLYSIAGTAEVAGIYAGAVDLRPAEQPRERILAAGGGAHYVNGKLLFLRDNTLVAQPFDSARLRLSGQPVVVAENVQAILSNPVFSASEAVLAYRSGSSATGYLLTWFDRTGKEIGTVGRPNSDMNARLSPDGMRAAVMDAGDSATSNIWLLDFARGIRTGFTFRPPAANPVWSPDGSRVFFASGVKLEAIFEKAASGAGPEIELLRQPGRFLYPTSISPDSRFLIYHSMPRAQGPGVPGETWVLPLAAGGRPMHLLGSPQFKENRAVISPDGRWIAYRSDESGRFEIYVRSIVTSGGGGFSLGEGKWQVSKEGVPPAPPAWRRDGRELFYLSERNVVTAVAVDGSRASLQLGSSTPLFTAPCSCAFDVSGDGQRFLVHRAAGAGDKSPITVVLNWQSELKGL